MDDRIADFLPLHSSITAATGEYDKHAVMLWASQSVMEDCTHSTKPFQLKLITLAGICSTWSVQCHGGGWNWNWYI